MKIIKRNGSEVEFDISKIENAITAANAEVPAAQRLTDRQISYAEKKTSYRSDGSASQTEPPAGSSVDSSV